MSVKNSVSPRTKHRHNDIVKFFRDYQADHGTPPTIREVGEAVGIKSTSSVSYHLDLMVNRGLLCRNSEGNTARSFYAPGVPSTRAAVKRETALLLADIRARIRAGEDADTVLSAALSNLDSATSPKGTRHANE